MAEKRRKTELTSFSDSPASVSEMRGNTRPPSLAHIRERALHTQTQIAQTIAELEAWRAEIDCTLAFLRAAK